MTSRASSLAPLLGAALIALAMAACGKADDPSNGKLGSLDVGSSTSGIASGAGGSCPAAEEVPIHLVTPTGTLEGTLELPAGCGPHPVVLLHAGSGPTDRDGNSPTIQGRNDCLKLVAVALSGRGIASVRYDKRGIAASALAGPADEAAYTFEMYIDDAVAWVNQLSTDPRFSGVTIAGHSEGSLIGLIAVKRSPAKAFISLEGAGRPAGDVLREQLAARLTGTLLDQANAILDSLEAGTQVAAVPPELASLFRPSVQPYIISWFQYDPAKEMASLTLPAAIIQGTADIQVGLQDARDLAAADPAAKLTIVNGMSHTLKAATLTQASQLAALTDPSLPVMPEVIDAMVALMNAE